jgi:DNA-binding NarL/FixJ family response regulator
MTWHSAILTEADVAYVLEALANGATTVDLAAEMGVHRKTISRIKNGTAWRYVTGGMPERHVLTREDVLAIDKALREGVRGTVIAWEFEISPQTVSAIKLGRNWGWITGRTAPKKFTRKAS